MGRLRVEFWVLKVAFLLFGQWSGTKFEALNNAKQGRLCPSAALRRASLRLAGAGHLVASLV